MIANMKRIYSHSHQIHRGFTLIELVVVLIILGILAVTALSRFINLNDEATESTVRYSAKAFKTSVDLANAAWAVKRLNVGIYNLSALPRSEDPNFAARGTSGVDVNANGWPAGIWEDWLANAPADTPEDPSVYGAIGINNVQDCAQAWIGLMDSTQTVARTANESGDYLASHLGGQQCLYTYQDDTRYSFFYDAADGTVEYQFIP
ncbi:prepilin-type N-terminal cleavage/methylation domain-containing protein [Corallincola holothuriorum]|uniref:Prepilin-type N-terminal cleavage/methylation domain-containing protein n=2 Tax=Corallincola holothuriorum TaxID=2282215 RepID=A0A368MYZ2_9GAMM|nr:prepilin-type N-terminal cleavage/methylation domain-containing protein [Corallincola holothuriorum]